MDITIITGKLGADAELYHAPSGDTAINFRVAVDKSYTNTDGVRVKAAKWLDCTKWVKDGHSTAVASYLLKGKDVTVQGEVIARAYTAKDGQPAAALDLKVHKVELQGSGPAPATQPSGAAEPVAESGHADSDPF